MFIHVRYLLLIRVIIIKITTVWIWYTRIIMFQNITYGYIYTEYHICHIQGRVKKFSIVGAPPGMARFRLFFEA